MPLSTEYPLWYLIFCLLAGLVYAVWLYRKNTFGDDSGRKPWWVWLLAFFRFASVSLIAFLLLGPLVNSLIREVEKPVIVIATDNSQSIVANKDSTATRAVLGKGLTDLKQNLSQNYEVRSYIFGEKVKEEGALDFADKQTNLSELLQELYNQYDNQNLGAVVLATDGIYNEGNSPLYASRNLKAPIYTLALGDTNRQRDLLIREVQHNELAYLGNTFPFNIEIEATNSAGASSLLEIWHKGKVVFSEPVQVTEPVFRKTVPVQLEANEQGVQRYQVRLKPIADEVSLVNNSRDVFIEVLDARQKILMVANAPHPDITAFRKVIEQNEHYEFELWYAGDANLPATKLKGYSLVILHQMPGNRNPQLNLIGAIKKQQIPMLLVLGSQTSYNLLNRLNLGIAIANNRNATNESQPIVNTDFSLFTFSETFSNRVAEFPPLVTPFGRYGALAGAEVLFWQQIGYVKTKTPLVFFSKNLESKTGVICGEGFWKWRLQEYALHQDHQATDELVNKIVQYLAVKNDKRLFRITSQRKNFPENTPVVFDAEVYNLSYELVNAPDVEMQIKDQEGKNYPFVFSKTANAYTLNAGLFPVGAYTYEAKVTVSGKTESLTGNFTISPLQAEFLTTTADHGLLYNLSQKTNGQLFYPNQLEALLATIKGKEEIKPVVYSRNEVQDLLNNKWLFYLLLTLLAVEWFLRKRNGAY